MELIHVWKINMERNHGGLEDQFPFQFHISYSKYRDCEMVLPLTRKFHGMGSTLHVEIFFVFELKH